MQREMHNNTESGKYISLEKNTLNFNVQKSFKKCSLFTNPIKKDTKKKEREEDIKKFTKLVLDDSFDYNIDERVLSSMLNNPQFLNDIMI